MGDTSALQNIRRNKPRKESMSLALRKQFTKAANFKDELNKEILNELRLLRALKTGRVPDTIRENDLLVDETSSEGISFQSKMDAITKRLFADQYDPEKHQFQFFISDDEKANAHIITVAKPPIIVFTKGLFEKLETEDELAGVLAHELTHQKIFDRIAMHHNSNPEEAMSDVWAVVQLQNAGYSPFAIQEALLKIEEDDTESKRHTLLNIMDPHPPTAIRVRNTENAIAIIEQKQRLNKDTTPLDPALSALVQQATHTPYVQQIKAKANYDEASTAEKIKLLSGWILDDYLPNNAAKGYSKRTSDYMDALKDLTKEAKEEGVSDLLLPLYYTLLDIGTETRKELYSAVWSLIDMIQAPHAPIPFTESDGIITSTRQRTPPLGVFRGLYDAMHGFVHAKTASEAANHARTINAFNEEYDITQSEMIGDVQRLPAFDYPRNIKDIENLVPFQFTWNKHLMWGTSSGELPPEQAQEVLLALQSFDIQDGRVPELKDKSRRLTRWPVDFRSADYSMDDLDMDKDGNVIGSKLDRSQEDRFREGRERKLRISEKKFLKHLDKRAEAALETVDWSELESDFWGFLKKYKDYLEPQLSIEDGGDLFIQEFTDRLETLCEESPSKFKPLLKQFLGGENAVIALKNKYMRSRNKAELTLPLSLPELMKGFKRKTHHHFSTLSLKRLAPIKGSKKRTAKGFLHSKGLSNDHPYARLTRKYAPEMLTPEQTAYLFEHMRGYNNDPSKFHPDEIIEWDFRALLGYKKPETEEELLQLAETLISSFPRRDSSSTLLETALSIEVHLFLLEKKDQKLDICHLTKLLSKKNRKLAHAYNPLYGGPFAHMPKGDAETPGAYSARDAQKEYHKLLEERLLINSKYDLGDEIPLDKLIRDFGTYSLGVLASGSLFTEYPELRQQYQQRIKDRITSIPHPAKRKKYYEIMLYELDLNDPDLRNWAVDGWVSTQAKIYNKMSEARRSWSLKRLTKKVIKRARKGQALNMLSLLLEATEAQEKDSLYVKDALIDGMLRKGSDVGLIASANDHVMDQMSGHPKLRRLTLEYITSPLTFETSVKTYNEIKKVYARTGAAPQSIQHFLKNNISLSDNAKSDIMSMMHKNFWSLPFPARTVYIERVLFPVNDKSDRNFNAAVEFILDCALPTDQPYAEEARKILSIHMEGCSKPLKRLILSALITASEKKDEDQQIRPGEVLSMVLSKTGAAGGKILQSVHSYLQSMETDDPDLIQLRDDLKKSKSDFNKPFRWDVFERIKQAVPAKRVKNTWVGKVLGSGSYGYTVALHRSGIRQTETALTLLRKDVEFEAKHQFQHYKNTAESLSHIDPKWQPLIAILENAKHMSAIEADFNIGAKQIQAAQKLYDGYKVQADGQTFKISTAALIQHGKEFKETKRANGVHFNDLPQNTDKQRKHKQAAAKAIFTAEISIMLSGAAFDYDRHGAQQRVKGNTIVMFDHGSLMYDLEKDAPQAPTQAEKQALGRIIANVYNSLKDETVDPVRILLDQLSEHEKQGDTAEFISSFKRGILALSDYRQAMGTNDEERNKATQDAVMAVMFSGGVDPVITNTVLSLVTPHKENSAENKESDTPNVAQFNAQALPKNNNSTITIKSLGQAAFQNRKAIIKTFALSYVQQKVNTVRNTGKNVMGLIKQRLNL